MSTRRHICCTLGLLGAGVLAAATLPEAVHAQTPELRIAAAADLQPIFPALTATYQRAAGVRLVPSFGSSATLAQQLLNGAPQDIFLAADFTHPQQLAAAGLTAGAPVAYARGVLVLWARKDSPAQPLSSRPGEVASRQDLERLLRPTITRVAIANTEHAPYGLAAMEALKALNLDGRLSSKLVLGENIGQAAQFALSGNAQAAFISLTSANSAAFQSAGTFVLVPPVYPEIRQFGVVLKQSSNRAAAEAFLHWLTSAEVQQKLADLGLQPVQ